MFALSFIVGLFVVASPGQSFPGKDVPNVGPEILDMLLATKQYELFSKLVKVDNVNLVRPSEKERSVNPMFNEELEFGDMIVPNSETEEARQGIRFDRFPAMKWQNRNVPYVISNDFNIMERGIIERSITKWNREVECIKFIPRTIEEDYVIVISGQGCWSRLGRIGGQQPLSLQNDVCLKEPTVLHEMEHAIGFVHEENRSDRDDFVEILFDNIPESSQSQYEKADINSFGLQGAYDYYSLMHSPINAPGTNKPAFRVLKDGVRQGEIGRGRGFTVADLNKIKMQYC